MKSRRNFLIQSTLATTAMIVLKPLTTFAEATSRFTGITDSYGKLVLLHTANIRPEMDKKVFEYLNNIKNKNSNAILLNTCNDLKSNSSALVFDASVQGSNDLSAITGEYKIIQKGNLRTGLISAKPGESDVVERINSLAAFLKKEKKCTLVVCLSQLGYKNNNSIDDISLAKKSNDLDIIIGGHADNFHKHPVVLLNNNNSEVIIHSAAGDFNSMGKIEIDFDNQGRKKQISFIN